MQFLGIDFGWTSQPSGAARLEFAGDDLHLRELVRIHAPEEVAAWAIDRLAGGPGMVAIDAPTIIRNPTGMRDCEREMHRHFGRYDAGCYPSNLGSAFAARTLALSMALEAASIHHASSIEPQLPGRYQIEVFPHAASIHLFSLDRILKYKKGRVGTRRASLERFQMLLETRLREKEPRLHLKGLAPVPRAGAALKAHEDQLDAILCAYIGAWWWYWGTGRSRVLGDRETGFIVVPVSEYEATTAAQTGGSTPSPQ